MTRITIDLIIRGVGVVLEVLKICKDHFNGRTQNDSSTDAEEK